MPFAERGGVKLFYERDGSGEPELVFVHGWCCDASAYAPQVEHFRQAHAVTVLELRGCGRSDRPAGGYDIQSLADDVAAVCEQAGARKPVVVGHSLGGMIAVELGARHPGLVRAVVSDDPGPIDPTPIAREVFGAFVDEMAGPGGEAVRRQWVVDTPGPTLEHDLAHRIVETMCAVPLETAAAVIRGVTEWNGAGAFVLCDAPILVLLSDTVGSNAPERLRAMRPDVTIGVTVGAGHFHQLEVPEQVNAMIERFVGLLSAD
jgi:pimeloyl-ACP methyl ester carboxylesterase